MNAGFAIILSLLAAGFGYVAIYTGHDSRSLIWDIGFVVSMLLLVTVILRIMFDRASLGLRVPPSDDHRRPESPGDE